MRTATAVLAAALAGSALTLAWQDGRPASPVPPLVAGPAPAPRGSSGTPTSGSGTGPGHRPESTRSTPAPRPPARKVVDGQVVSTPYGDVQVQLVLTGGRITDVRALHLTDSGSHSRRLSAYAAPILHDEVLTAQSAQVDMVSGATYTSQGYLGSLQSALDTA